MRGGFAALLFLHFGRHDGRALHTLALAKGYYDTSPTLHARTLGSCRGILQLVKSSC
jgi:hypothetical protein